MAVIAAQLHYSFERCKNKEVEKKNSGAPRQIFLRLSEV